MTALAFPTFAVCLRGMILTIAARASALGPSPFAQGEI
jgi:hypothetical protein